MQKKIPQKDWNFFLAVYNIKYNITGNIRQPMSCVLLTPRLIAKIPIAVAVIKTINEIQPEIKIDINVKISKITMFIFV